jgi:hypothetical protein
VRNAVRISLPRNGQSICPSIVSEMYGPATPADMSLRIRFTCRCERRRTHHKPRAASAAWRYCWQARSYARTVHGIKRDYPDQRDKSERHKRGHGHNLAPRVELWAEARFRSRPSLSHSLVLHTYDLRNSPGSLAISAAIRRGSPLAIIDAISC